MLFRPEDFEPLVDESWNEARIGDGICEIVADTQSALRGPKLLWPAEGWDRWQATSPLKGIYCGAAGVLWALADLRDRGHAEPALDLGLIAEGALARYRDRPDLARATWPPEPRESSLFSGEAGVLLVAYRLAPSRGLADALLRRVRENLASEANELMWGIPGTLVAARLMHGWTGDERWRAAWQESADVLLGRRREDGTWVQRLYGFSERSLGPVHGMVGNVSALGQLLDPGRRSELVRVSGAVLERTAIVEDGLANWPPADGVGLENSRGEIRVQWCHGAPGIVTSAADYLDEYLLLAGAELTWVVGAHGADKGSSLCHGTAGNGYALLSAFARTGDELWLARARRFAVHALGQVREARRARGRGRYSLFTGDLGVALFLADCLDARPAFPLISS